MIRKALILVRQSNRIAGIIRVIYRRGLPFLLVIVSMGWTSDALGQVELSEADIIRLARRHSPSSVVAKANVAQAKARSRSAGLLSNPSLNWTRETVMSQPGSSQDIVSATLPIDIVGPLARRSLVASDGAWVEAESSLLRSQAILDALLVYVQVVDGHGQAEVFAQSLAYLEEATRILARREAVGQASGYESTRLALATELRRSQWREARAQFESARVRLSVILGVPLESLEVGNSLHLLSSGKENELVQRRLTSRDDLRSARESQRLAKKAQNRAAWAWLPYVALVGGMKHVSDLGGAYGYVAGVDLDIPIFDRGQDLRAAAKAQRGLAVARSQALSRNIDGEVQAALVTFQMARDELQRFESQTAERMKQLLVSAQSGYREGERSIVELLDAQNTEIEVEARHLALRVMAKQAELRLRAAAGDFQ